MGDYEDRQKARNKAIISSNNPLSWANQDHTPKKVTTKKPAATKKTPQRVNTPSPFKMPGANTPAGVYPTIPSFSAPKRLPTIAGVQPQQPNNPFNPVQGLMIRGAQAALPSVMGLGPSVMGLGKKVLGIMGAGKKGAAPFHQPISVKDKSPFKLGTGTETADAAQEQAADPRRTIADYMAMFSDSGGGATADMSGFDAQEKDARRRAAEGDIAISGIYAALQRDIKAQDPIRAQNAAASTAAANTTDAQATNFINAGAQSVSAQRAQMLQNLGMQDQAPGNGSVEAGAAQADALGDVAQRGQINATQRNTNLDTGNTLSLANQTAAGYQGATERASLQGNLSSLLAQIAQQRAQANTEASAANASAQSGNFSNALRMFEADNSQYNADRTYQAGQDAEDWNQYLEGSKFQADQARQSGGSQDDAVTSQIDSRMLASGISGQQQTQIWQLLNEAQGQNFNANMLTKYKIDPKNINFVTRNLAEYNKAFNN